MLVYMCMCVFSHFNFQLQNSTDNVVVLRRVTLQSTGRYRCEVSGEAPSFQTVSGHEDMIVVGKKRYCTPNLFTNIHTHSP